MGNLNRDEYMRDFMVGDLLGDCLMRFKLAILFIVVTGSFVWGGDKWPEFRGPTSDGHSDAKGLPVQWSESKNITWKTAIHGQGWSSPVVWGKQIWMTTATKDGQKMYAVCVNLDTGKIEHDIKIFETENPQEKHSLNSYASPTPVMEQGRVYVHFGTFGTAAIDTASGEKLWERRDINCDHKVGPGSSPVLYGDLLIFHMDGTDVQFVVALNKETGKTVWKKDRSIDYSKYDPDVRKAFCTPFMWDVKGKTEMISLCAQGMMGYDPLSGQELWKIRFKGFSNTARPLVYEDMVFVCTCFGGKKLLAVRLGGKGDVTDSHIVWQYDKNVPIRASSVLVDGLLYMVSDNSAVTCLDAKTGHKIWRKRIGGNYAASTIYADGHIYFFNMKGKTTVIQPGREYKKVALNRLDDGFMASPAVVGNLLILRTEKNLYRIEKSDKR